MSRRKQASRRRSKRGRSSSCSQALAKHRNKLPKHKASLSALLKWFLPNTKIFAKIKFHGNTKWVPRNLVWLALLWSWSECRHLTDAFTDAADCCRKLLPDSPLTTYQGLMNALTRWTPTLMPLLWLELQQRMEEIGGKFWRMDGWVPIAFDGSRSSAPRTESNEKDLCAPNYGQGITAKYRKKKSKGLRRKRNKAHEKKKQPQVPQAWITLLWHMGLRLPWSWRLGPSNSSERAHVMELLGSGKFPKKTLFCGDAGFVGYDLWSHILEQGAHFLVRVGANVSLLTEQAHYSQQGDGIVLCWPKTKQSKQPPLRLRLVRVRIGKTDMWMLTSILEKSQLTKQQIVKFYKMRWGIEVEFRGLKQTLERAKLRCRDARRLRAELDWSILAMAVAELMALKEQLAKDGLKNKKRPADPIDRSLAHTMRALRLCMRNLNERPGVGKELRELLRKALTDDYNRKSKKKARYQPPNPDKKPLGNPKVRPINTQEKKKLQRINEALAA